MEPIHGEGRIGSLSVSQLLCSILGISTEISPAFSSSCFGSVELSWLPTQSNGLSAKLKNDLLRCVPQTLRIHLFASWQAVFGGEGYELLVAFAKGANER